MLSTPQISPRAMEISARRDALARRIATAAREAGRDPATITVLAVTKGHPVEAARAALRVGMTDLGENYLDEALPKIEALRAERPAPVWHFIGRVQGNKTRPIAMHFDWVHGVDRSRIAQRLSAQRGHYQPPLNVCVQVNVTGEASKAGVTPAEAPALMAEVAALPRLRLRGLMCMLPEGAAPAEQRAGFAALRRLLQAGRATGFALDTLSMGMSDDLEAAVAEGATLVRIGTALFGARE